MPTLSRTSRFFNHVGHLVIGPPIPMMRHVYLLPADRVCQEPIEPDDVDWMRERITLVNLSYESHRRIGPLTTTGIVAYVFAALVALAFVMGIKSGTHKVENAISHATASSASQALTPQQQALKRACDADRANGNALSPACANLPQE